MAADHSNGRGHIGVIDAETTAPSPDKIERVKAVYDRLDLAARCRSLIDRYTDEAIEALASTPISRSARDFFSELALSARTRNH